MNQSHPYNMKPAHMLSKVEFHMSYIAKNKKELFELVMGNLDTSSLMGVRIAMWSVQHKHLIDIGNL